MEQPVLSEENNTSTAAFDGNIYSECLAAGPNLYEVPSGTTATLQSAPPSDAFQKDPASLNPSPLEALPIDSSIASFHSPTALLLVLDLLG